MIRTKRGTKNLKITSFILVFNLKNVFRKNWN